MSTLEFDKKLYTLTLLKKAAYKFSHVVSVTFSETETHLCCHLTFSVDPSDAEVSRYIEELQKEILDQDLREIVRSETETSRNLILAYAFSSVDRDSDE